MPLLYGPGEGWAYSVSIDWAGKMVERVNQGVRLGEYMKQHIWEPLGMSSTGFRPEENEHIRSHLCATTARTPSGELVPSPSYSSPNPHDDLGGGGLYSSSRDYLKVLIALLKNDGQILKPETVKQMFQPQLEDEKHLLVHVLDPNTGAMFRGGVESKAWNFGLGGILNMEDVEGICRKGTLTWGGLPNLFWVRV
jgi:CubicO group peptidase (beta-lactamase class C family)